MLLNGRRRRRRRCKEPYPERERFSQGLRQLSSNMLLGITYAEEEEEEEEEVLPARSLAWKISPSPLAL